MTFGTVPIEQHNETWSLGGKHHDRLNTTTSSYSDDWSCRFDNDVKMDATYTAPGNYYYCAKT